MSALSLNQRATIDWPTWAKAVESSPSSRFALLACSPTLMNLAFAWRFVKKIFFARGLECRLQLCVMLELSWATPGATNNPPQRLTTNSETRTLLLSGRRVM